MNKKLLKRSFWVFPLLGMALAVGMIGRTVKADEAKKAAAGKNWYVIETKHNGPDCLAALDEINKKNLLSKTYFGCKTGDHRGWTVLQAENKEVALTMIPTDQRPDAEVVQVSKFTPEELKQIHAAHG